MGIGVFGRGSFVWDLYIDSATGDYYSSNALDVTEDVMMAQVEERANWEAESKASFQQSLGWASDLNEAAQARAAEKAAVIANGLDWITNGTFANAANNLARGNVGAIKGGLARGGSSSLNGGSYVLSDGTVLVGGPSLVGEIVSGAAPTSMRRLNIITSTDMKDAGERVADAVNKKYGTRGISAVASTAGTLDGVRNKVEGASAMVIAAHRVHGFDDDGVDRWRGRLVLNPELYNNTPDFLKAKGRALGSVDLVDALSLRSQIAKSGVNCSLLYCGMGDDDGIFAKMEEVSGDDLLKEAMRLANGLVR